MILPRYSSRTLLLIFAALSLAMTALAFALNGSGWAIAVVAVLGFAALLLIVHGSLFGLIYAFGGLPVFRDSSTPPLVPGPNKNRPPRGGRWINLQ